MDSAPGGTGSISDALGDGGGNQVLIDFINALQQDLYSFIPTMSSLAIDNPDWFTTPDLNDSPFVNFYIPTENENHVTVTAASAQFALDEIRNVLIGVSENELNGQFQLSQNPVHKIINIKIPNQISTNEITTKVFSFTGQKLMEQTWTSPQGEIIWNQNLASGIYLLKVNNGAATQTIKMVVE